MKGKHCKPDANGKYACGCVWSLAGYWLYQCPDHAKPSKKPKPSEDGLQTLLNSIVDASAEVLEEDKPA